MTSTADLAAAVVIAAPDPTAPWSSATDAIVTAAWRALVAATGDTLAATDAVLALDGGADALTHVSGSPYPVTIDCRLDIDADTLTLIQHGEYAHGWECFDTLFTAAQLRRTHDDYHGVPERPDWLDPDDPDHAHDDLSASGAHPWRHLVIGDVGVFWLRDGTRIAGRLTARTEDTLTIGATDARPAWHVAGFASRDTHSYRATGLPAHTCTDTASIDTCPACQHPASERGSW